jgi:S1-C subfamily serine protease
MDHPRCAVSLLAPAGADRRWQWECLAGKLTGRRTADDSQPDSEGQPFRRADTGEILTTSGYILTNSHVVSGFRDLTVLLSNGQTVPAQLIGDVPQEDLAVLKIKADNLKPIAVGDSNKVQVGDFALAMGSPLGLEQSATTGIVSALNRTARVVTNGQLMTLNGLIQTSAPINPGNSGGALVNLKGELIGIPTLGAVDPTSGAAANGIGFAISSNHAREVLATFTY